MQFDTRNQHSGQVTFHLQFAGRPALTVPGTKA